MDEVGRLALAVQALVADAQRGIARNVDVPRVSVLGLVAGTPRLRPGEVAQRLGMAASSVTRHVQALEDAGQLAVLPDPQDARTCRLEVTAAGRRELADLARVGAETFAAVVEDWPDEDIPALTELLERLRRDWAERGDGARRRQPPNRQPRWRRPPPGTEEETTRG